MADSRTTHLNLIKQDPESLPNYLDDHENLEILDEEVWKRGKAFNGQTVGEDGGFHVRTIPYAENLETSSSQSSDENYIIRTTGGDASLRDGDAWLTLIKGTRKHTGYVPQSIQMTVTPMARPVPAAITATLNEETFIAYVQEAGTYTITYTTDWSTSPAAYGITVSNEPISGDSITVVWDGESDPEMTVNAVERQAPNTISATIDDSVFVAYVTQSGTTTLTYSTSWSADPTLYGITVTGTPIAGDVITVVYVKEVRGTITQSNPETFVSTGWNLYNHALGYARVIVYSETYNFKISGTYTALEFATTPTGTRTTITPVSGAFSIPGDGYLFVTGGNSTDTAIWMTWSDWASGYNWTGTEQGEFAAYTEDEIDFSSFMATNFPYGLMQVGTVQDEINLNIGIATSCVVRQAYNATNLANAKASGRQYEYDENYIYIERETPVTYTVGIDGDYMAYDHGLEYFTGTAQEVYAQTLYGANLKNKLERDVLTISQQTLTSAQQAQVMANIGAASSADLGSKSSASGVTGSDAFSKIATLNSKMIGFDANTTPIASVSDIVSIMNAKNNNDIHIIGASADVLSSLLNVTTTIGGPCILLKASASNAYFYAYNKEIAGIGNIALSNGAITSTWFVTESKTGTEYSSSGAVDATQAGTREITCPAGTYIVTFGGQSQSKNTACNMNINGASPWHRSYIGLVTPDNTGSNMCSAYKTVRYELSVQTKLTLNYTAGWYFAEISAIRIK